MLRHPVSFPNPRPGTTFTLAPGFSVPFDLDPSRMLVIHTNMTPGMIFYEILSGNQSLVPLMIPGREGELSPILGYGTIETGDVAVGGAFAGVIYLLYRAVKGFATGHPKIPVWGAGESPCSGGLA